MGDAHEARGAPPTLIKGATILARLAFVTERGGEELLARVLERLSPEDREKMSSKILPSERFPLELNGRLDEAIAQVVDPASPTAVYRELGRASAERNLHSLHAIFLRGKGPHDVLADYPSVRRTYYSDGTAAYERVGSTSGVLRLEGAASHTEADCESTAGYFERAIELLGGDAVEVAVVRCRSRGDAGCELRCEWQ